MALFGFGNKKEGGLMDVIRCDEEEYLMWKWSPSGIKSRKENAIRYGSSLRVKDGEVAVFVYKQANGTIQDYVEGPFDQTIKTANLPILSGIVGSAFGGASPFQAEIYFINLAENISFPFFYKNIGIRDVRSNNFTIPVSVKGKIIFNLKDYKKYIKINRMRNFDLEDLKEQSKENILSYLTGAIQKITRDRNISMTEISGSVMDVNEIFKPLMVNDLEEVFGLNVKSVVISEIAPDETSDQYIALVKTLQDMELRTKQTQTDVFNKNVEDMQQVNIGNYEDVLRIQREEAQRQQRLQTETTHITAHQLNQQADVAKTAAQSLGELGSNAGGGMEGGGGGFNPAAMMTGMMMGGAVGSSMTNMMGNMMQGVNTPHPPAPPQSAVAEYHVVINGRQAGPYTIEQLRQMMEGGNFGLESYVWKTGMGNWDLAKNVPELSVIFAAVPPPVPGGTPPVPPAISY